MIQAYVGTEIYVAGPGEWGDPFTAERYVVLFETKSGRRFCHKYYFNGAESWVDFEGYQGYRDIRKEAEDAAQALCDRVNAALRSGRKLNQAHWEELSPVYGSEAYEAMGTEEQYAYCEAHDLAYPR